VVYDTHVSIEHARHIRRVLEAYGGTEVQGCAEPLASGPRRWYRCV
jgi:hypothetical protein